MARFIPAALVALSILADDRRHGRALDLALDAAGRQGGRHE